MAGEYRGVLRVHGSVLRGWLIDVARPARRVAFDLVIDGEKRGSYVANARRRFFAAQKGSDEDTHGFSIPIKRAWISGAPQTILIADGVGLSLSMLAKLGPRRHEHFDDRVSGGQVSIGAAAKGAARQSEDDEPESKAVNKALLRQIGALGDAELVNLLAAVDREVVLERVARHDKNGDWEKLQTFRRVVAGGATDQILAAFGRGALKAHSHALAGRVTTAAAAMHPQSFEANYLAGAAKSHQGEFDEAMRYLRAADRLEEGGARAKREMVVVLNRQLRQELPIERREEIRAEHLTLLKALSSAGDIGTQVKYRVPYATALYTAGRYEDAAAAADVILANAPHDTRALMLKARALVARNIVGEAQKLYERIIDLEPGHRGARTNLRILAALVEDEARERDGNSVIHARDVRALEDVAQSWVCVASGTDANQAPAPGPSGRIGYAKLGDAEFWRRDALLGLRESGLIEALDPGALERWKPFYDGRTPRKRGIAVLASRNGADLYGGGEHFLEEAAEHHARQGYEVVILGVRPDLEGQVTVSNGRRSVFVGEHPAQLRKFLLENDVSLVHAISGMGFAVAEALNFTNIPFLYGVHFWNELLGDPERSLYFDEVSGSALFRREFLVILSRATAIYANSRYTQKLVEDGFGVRCPVLYASPRERAHVKNGA